MFPKHIPTLDGLRGFAALWVVINHLKQQSLLPSTNGQTGEYGVLLFFILSGFLMGHLYLPEPFSKEKIWNYSVSRISRVVPMFYFAIILCYIASIFFGTNFVFYLSSVDFFRLLTFNGSKYVFWSVGPEVQFYIFFVVVWGCFARRKEIGASILPPALLILAMLLFTQSMFPGVVLASKLHVFLTGTAMAVVAARIPPTRSVAPEPMILAGQLLAVGIVLFLTFTPYIGSTVLDPFNVKLDPLFNAIHGNLRWTFLMAAILFIMAVETPVSRFLLANRVMRLTGKYSFSIYLLHVPVIVLARDVTQAWGWSVSMQAVAAIVMVAAIGPLAFHLVERPGQSGCRRLLGGLREKYLAARNARVTSREIAEEA
ncbi:hypothetical protein BH10PSE12_BH10PSE12_08720 [soil metagenome]